MNGKRYRYGFNGQEKDNEIAGEGNINTAMFWEYDTRLGRRWNLDPVPIFGFSEYVCLLNNPFRNIDVLGDKPTPAEAAAMSAHVYGDKSDKILTGGWKVSTRDFGIVKNTKSGLKSQVYERTDIETGVTEYVYATAGTEDANDAKHDVLQAVGASQQYTESMENAEKISQELRKTNTELTFTGHSLGGGLAAANAYKTGKNAITFNAAGVSNRTIKPNGISRIQAYILTTDPLNKAQNNNFTSIGRLMPDVNGQRYYMLPMDLASIYNGHSMDNVLKNFGIDPISNKLKYDFHTFQFKSYLDNYTFRPIIKAIPNYKR